MSFFLFDWGARALVYPGPDGKPRGITVNELLGAGWKCTEADLRMALPRADASRLARVQ